MRILFTQRFKCVYPRRNYLLFSQKRLSTQTSTPLNCSSISDWNAASSGKTLVIVESPAKARTIQKFLSLEEFDVDFCAGHVRDLPTKYDKVPAKFKSALISEVINISTASIGIDVFNNFEPIYVPMLSRKSEVLSRLKAKIGNCSRVLFATDDDREGEAIAWHLIEVLKPNVPYKRAVFHEISKAAILESFSNPRDLNMNVVHSQEARRALDRLAGFTISPVLWRYVAPGISAGRVQSCGLNLIADRERKRWSFVPSEFYSIKGTFRPESGENSHIVIDSQLIEYDGKRPANEKSFDINSGLLNQGNDSHIFTKDTTEALLMNLSSESSQFKVLDVVSKAFHRAPPPAFITSTLQRACSTLLKLSPSETMRVAQALYEEGFITYMRTDSSKLSLNATATCLRTVGNIFGSHFVDEKREAGKSSSNAVNPINAQEAHEAIRPVEFEGTFKTPAQTGLIGIKKDMYSLIYARTLASVMNKAEYVRDAIFIEAVCFPANSPSVKSIFKSNKSSLVFKGYLATLDLPVPDDYTSSDVTQKHRQVFDFKIGQTLKAATQVADQSAGENDFISKFLLKDDDHHSADDEDTFDARNQMSENNRSDPEDPDSCEALHIDGFLGKKHLTRPPNRFTEASFIKELERIGIGRPSTYASILETLRSERRRYVYVSGGTVIPSIIGMIVDKFLSEHFSELTKAQFTARMENSLDSIATGELDKISFLSGYYLGKNHDGLLKNVEDKVSNKMIDHVKSRTLSIPFLDPLGVIRLGGGTGAFFESHTHTPVSPEKNNLSTPNEIEKERSYQKWKLPDAMQYDIREITSDSISALMANQETMIGVVVGIDEAGNTVKIRSGRFGRYLQVGEDTEKTKSYFPLPKWLPSNVSLAKVLEFVQLPRVLGVFSAFDEVNVIVDVSSGELTVGIEGYPLRVPLQRDGVYPSEVSLEEAILVLPDLASIRDSQRSLGPFDGKDVSVLKGRFGHYLRCGDVITGLKKLKASEITLSEAVELLQKYGKMIGSKKKAKKTKKANVSKKSKKSKVAEKTILLNLDDSTTTSDTQPLMQISLSSKGKHQAKKSEPRLSIEPVLLKRKPSAYIAYCAAERRRVMSENPSATFGSISKLLAADWKNLTEAEKLSFVPK